MTRACYLAASAALLALVGIAFAVGRYPVSLAELFSVLTGQPVGANVEMVVLQVRGPRGAALLHRMFTESRLFRLIVDEVEKTLTYVDLEIAREYAELVPDSGVRNTILAMVEEEYQRTVEDTGSRAKAEAELLARQKRVDKLNIVPLTPAEADMTACISRRKRSWPGLPRCGMPVTMTQSASSVLAATLMRRSLRNAPLPRSAVNISLLAGL